MTDRPLPAYSDAFQAVVEAYLKTLEALPPSEDLLPQVDILARMAQATAGRLVDIGLVERVDALYERCLPPPEPVIHLWKIERASTPDTAWGVWGYRKTYAQAYRDVLKQKASHSGHPGIQYRIVGVTGAFEGHASDIRTK